MGGWLQALIGRLEDRIAAVTTIPRHRDEEPIYVHRITPGEDDPNIHHDKANKEYVIHLYRRSSIDCSNSILVSRLAMIVNLKTALLPSPPRALS